MKELILSAICFYIGLYLLTGITMGFKNKDAKRYTFYFWIMTISAFIIAPSISIYFGMPYNIGAALIALTITALFIFPFLEKLRLEVK